MFGLLKKKISSFISSIVQKEEEPREAKRPELEQEPQREIEPEPAKEEPKPMEEPVQKSVEPEPVKKIEQKPVRRVERKPEPELQQKPAQKPIRIEPKPEIFEKPKPKIEIQKPKEEKKPELKIEEKKEPILDKFPQKFGRIGISKFQYNEKPKPQPRVEEERWAPKAEGKKPEPPAPAFVPRAQEEEKKLEVKLSLGTKIRSFISSEVEIKEGDVSELLDGLNMALLESDVAYEVADHITSELRSKLVGMRVPKGSVDGSIKSAVRGSLLEVLSIQGVNLLEAVREKPKPVKILLLGPNGAGKTTTMAKLSTMLKGAGFTSVFSASDTFRAAAIEQAEKHGERLGVRVIKHEYGADPTAVAFDAVNYARAHNIDVVLIDSAGRQETNRNLIDEMKKLDRVIKPDLKIFIGESIAGNALVNQVKSFSEAVGLDGVILTKLDCDAKGGTALSLAKATGVPILYFGIGQGYSDLVPFSAEFVVDQIMG